MLEWGESEELDKRELNELRESKRREDDWDHRKESDAVLPKQEQSEKRNLKEGVK